MLMLARLLLKTANPGAPVIRRAAPTAASVLFTLLVVTVSSLVAVAPQAAQAFGMPPCLKTADSSFGDPKV
jgi:hypothetical protein